MEDLKFVTADKMVNDDFSSTFNKGFQMNINGFRISVQYGPGNYVNSDVRYSDEDPQNHGVWSNGLAEVLIWDKNGPLFEYEDGLMNSDVIGHLNSNTVARIISVLIHNQPEDDVRPAIAQIVKASH
jgi:hypothetical protein